MTWTQLAERNLLIFQKPFNWFSHGFPVPQEHPTLRLCSGAGRGGCWPPLDLPKASGCAKGGEGTQQTWVEKMVMWRTNVHNNHPTTLGDRFFVTTHLSFFLLFLTPIFCMLGDNLSSANRHHHPIKAIWWLGRPNKTSETAFGAKPIFRHLQMVCSENTWGCSWGLQTGRTMVI